MERETSTFPELTVSLQFVLKMTVREDPMTIDPAELNKPLKKILNEQKYNYLTSDPENRVGHDLLRAKFNLPPPN
jgi:hypothetical protein